MLVMISRDQELICKFKSAQIGYQYQMLNITNALHKNSLLCLKIYLENLDQAPSVIQSFKLFMHAYCLLLLPRYKKVKLLLTIIHTIIIHYEIQNIFLIFINFKISKFEDVLQKTCRPKSLSWCEDI